MSVVLFRITLSGLYCHIIFPHSYSKSASNLTNSQIGLYGRVVKSPASGAGLRKAGVGSNPTAVKQVLPVHFLSR